MIFYINSIHYIIFLSRKIKNNEHNFQAFCLKNKIIGVVKRNVLCLHEIEVIVFYFSYQSLFKWLQMDFCAIFSFSASETVLA